MELLTGKGYLSFSAVNQLSTCGEQFLLTRVMRLPDPGSWALHGGKAFHTATEWLDKGDYSTAELAWSEAWREETKDIEDPDAVRATGRASKEWPNKENPDWWNAKGPEMLNTYLQWRDQRFAAGWGWVELPGGKPAIEFQVLGELGGVPVRGYIDRVMHSPDGEVHLYDIKTGSQEPTSIQQHVYAELMEQTIGVRPTHYAYYLARKGNTGEIHDLDLERPNLSGIFTTARRAIEHEIFLPSPGMLCKACSVRDFCSAMGSRHQEIATVAQPIFEDHRNDQAQGESNGR
jgi:putative RecB family exonuclease